MKKMFLGILAGVWMCAGVFGGCAQNPDSETSAEKEDVKALFKEAASHLETGGLFCFDTHSLDRLDEFEGEYNETGQFEDGVQYQWSIMSEDEYIYQDFAFYRLDGTVLEEHHMQRVYDPEFLIQELEEYFDVISVKTDFDQEGISEGEKYFFAARKKRGIQS